MSAEREDLARTIVWAYHSIGIPAKVHHGMVLIHRDAEMVGPFQAELLAPLYRQEIETIKKDVLAKLETYGIIEILKRFNYSNRIHLNFNRYFILRIGSRGSLLGIVKTLFGARRTSMRTPISWISRSIGLPPHLWFENSAFGTGDPEPHRNDRHPSQPKNLAEILRCNTRSWGWCSFRGLAFATRRREPL